MNNKLEVSFLIEAKKYGEYKDICRMCNTNPAVEINRHILDTINYFRKHFMGFKLAYTALCSSTERRSNIGYKGWEKTRQVKLAEITISHSPDLIIAEDYYSEYADSFTSHMINNGYVPAYTDKSSKYALFIKDSEKAKVIFEQKEIDDLTYFELTKESSKDENLILAVYIDSNIDSDTDCETEKLKRFMRFSRVKRKNAVSISFPDAKTRKKLYFTSNEYSSKWKSLIRYETEPKDNGLTDRIIYLFTIYKKSTIARSD